MCKCDSCHTYDSGIATRVVDGDGNLIYEAPPKKCPKCQQYIHYINPYRDYTADKIYAYGCDMHELGMDADILMQSCCGDEIRVKEIAKELTVCPQCGGKLECEKCGLWD